MSNRIAEILFLIENSDFSRFATIIQHSFSIEQIEKFQDNLSWDLLSSNENLQWNDELLFQLENKWNFEVLSDNPSLVVTKESLQRLKDKFVLPWVVGTSKTNWRPELLELVMPFIKWDAISIANLSNMPEDWFWKNRCNLYWDDLSWNENMPWSVNFIKKFEDFWNWKSLADNPGISFSKDLPQIFPQNGRWDSWKQKPYNVEEDIRNLSWELINDRSFSYNWSEKLIEKYESKLYFRILSHCKYLPWSIEFIEKYQDKWVWSYPDYYQFSISHNPYLPWSYELIKYFEDRWEWGSERIPFGYNLPAEPIYFRGLADLQSLPWTIEFIREFEHHFDFKAKSQVCLENLAMNKGLWNKVFKGTINDEVLRIVL